MTDRTIIGQKIAELRKEKGLTQAELADLLGVTHQAVSQWERSETFPDILTLPKIAEIFGENLNSLLGIESGEPSSFPETDEDPHSDKDPAAGEEGPTEEKDEDTVMIEDGEDEPEPTVEDAGDSYQIHIPPIKVPGIPAIELPLISVPKVKNGSVSHELEAQFRESQENARRQAEAIRAEAMKSAEEARRQAEALRAEAMKSAEEARQRAAIMQEEARRSAENAKKQAEANNEELLFIKAVALAAEAGTVTTSLIQSKLAIGYGQAARILDRMEALGYIAPQNGLGPREVLIKPDDLNDVKPGGGFEDFYKEMSARAEAHKAEFEKIAENYEKEHAAEIEEMTRQYEEEHAEEIEERIESDGSNIHLGSLEDYSLPVSDETYDFGGADGAYEIAFIRDGRIIANFIGSPERHVTLIVKGVGGSLKSELSVTVDGTVNGTATSGLGMTVNGNVNGPAHAGLELNCGDVAGNADAGLGITCGAISGNANAGMGVHCASAGGDGTRVNDAGTEFEFSADGKNVTINGDYDGDLTGALSVTIQGDVNGDVSANGPTAIGGDVSG
ncbi:MAG: helix-turn-helix domain-containing protein, partial [Clostridiales bacterium]|nr:helix-turn-helix domain-containing protein [Clostridiales bacterium]